MIHSGLAIKEEYERNIFFSFFDKNDDWVSFFFRTIGLIE